MTDEEDRTVLRFKGIAERVRRKLSDLNVKSSNKFWNLKKKETGEKLGAQRDKGYASVEDMANAISESRVGNCGEKGHYYAYWASRDPEASKAPTPRIYVITSYPTWDHMWAVMCQVDLAQGRLCHLEDFGVAACMLDGWSEDYYFPNIGKLDSIRLNVWRFQNPFQIWVRSKVKTVNERKDKSLIEVSTIVK